MFVHFGVEVVFGVDVLELAVVVCEIELLIVHWKGEDKYDKQTVMTPLTRPEM